MKKLIKKPLTRSFASRIHDLSHKGRGILTVATTCAHRGHQRLIMGKDTSPLVGEVAQSAGEGYPRPIGASSRNLENLKLTKWALGFLNIRDPGLRSSNQNPGSRILRKAKPRIKSGVSFSKFRDDDLWVNDDLWLLPLARSFPCSL